MPATDRPSPRVLIVDPSEETRDVLCELLARTGILTQGAGTATGGCQALQRQGCSVLVFDADSVTTHEVRLLFKEAAGADAPVVVVGTNRPSAASETAAFVRKPYHYRELVHKIWASLGATGIQARAAA